VRTAEIGSRRGVWTVTPGVGEQGVWAEGFGGMLGRVWRRWWTRRRLFRICDPVGAGP
jgi:hypothetical protein